jgi:tetratricopeptide (TPR) repeat protein
MSGMKVRSNAATGFYEPIGCFVADPRTQEVISIQLGEPGTPGSELGCATLVTGCLQKQREFVPGLVQVRDSKLAAMIRPALAPYGIRTDVVDEMPGMDALVAALTRDLLPPPPPGWLDAPGMTLERLTRFAEAAAMMLKAAPWQYLANEDLIHVESPAAPDGALRCACVMGRGGEQFGFSFFPSRDAFERVLKGEQPAKAMSREGAVSLTFQDAGDIPAGDPDFWRESQLPLAGENAYPLLLRYPPSSGFQRLDGAEVTFVEGLCRALAATSEEQIDAGRWEQSVQTHDGPVRYVLSIPSLIDAMRGQKPDRRMVMHDRRGLDASMLAVQKMLEANDAEGPEEMNALLQREFAGGQPQLPPPTTPLEQAQWLCYEAFDYIGRRRIQLAREALKISPDVADAWCILAEQRGFDPAGSNELFRQGVEAGRRALGEEPFEDSEYPFWGEVISRPYMRARQGYAETLRELGRKAEAADEFKAMLKLNPRDNQGIRHQLAPLLLELGRLDELDELLGKLEYSDDRLAEWAYVRALLAFRRQAGSPKAKSQALAALKTNPHVPKYLLGRADLPPSPPPLFSPGDEREAMSVALSQKKLWEETPLALDWLGKVKREINQATKQKKDRRKR